MRGDHTKTEYRKGQHMKKPPKKVHVTSPESPQKQRTAALKPRATTNSSSETSASSSIYSGEEVITIQSQDVVLPTQLQDSPMPSREGSFTLQSNDISSCSEVETVLGMSQISQPRRRARKRRRGTSKLSLSQTSVRQQQQQQQASRGTDPVQPSKKVTYMITSSSSSSSSCSKEDNSHTNPTITGCGQGSLSGSESLFTSSLLTGAQHTTEPWKHCTKSSSHRQAQVSSSTIVKSGGGGTNIKAHSSIKYQHTSDKAGGRDKRVVSLQRASSPVNHSSLSHKKVHFYTHPQTSHSDKQEDLTLISEDSDVSVYYEAASRLSILEESCAGPSGAGTTQQYSAGQQHVLPVRQEGNANSSSSSFSTKESDYTSHSCSSSGSNTFVSESVLDKAVVINTHIRPLQKAAPPRHFPPHQKVISKCLIQPSSHPDKGKVNPHLRINCKRPPTTMMNQVRGKRSKEVVMLPSARASKMIQQNSAEVSSSTSEYLSEDEPTSKRGQGARGVDVQTQPRVATITVVSSSSCSSSSNTSLLTETGKGCIQTIGKVFQQYFGGTVENNLTLLQKHNFNLLQCLVDLQASPHPPSTSTHQSSP